MAAWLSARPVCFPNLADQCRILIDQTHFMSVLAVGAHCFVIRTSLGTMCPISGFPCLNCNFDEKLKYLMICCDLAAKRRKSYHLCQINKTCTKIQETGLHVQFVLIGRRKPSRNLRGSFEELRGSFEELRGSFEEASRKLQVHKTRQICKNLVFPYKLWNLPQNVQNRTKMCKIAQNCAKSHKTNKSHQID